MKPIDYRNSTFDELQARGLDGDRRKVLDCLLTHGPATTEELAARTGLSILTVRPRTTELYQLGLVVLAESPRPAGATKSRGGCYRAATVSEALAHFTAQQRAALHPQTELPLTAQ